MIIEQRVPCVKADDSDGCADVQELIGLCNRLANLVHEDVMQSLSVCLVQVELGRRHFEQGDPGRALSELDSASNELQSMAEVLHLLTKELSAPGGSTAPPH